MISISQPIAANPLETCPASEANLVSTDPHSFEGVLQEHLPQVRAIVERMRKKLPQSVEAEELYSIGVTGLIAAARNYSPAKAGSFASYASTKIRGAILDELRRSDWMSRSKRSKAKRLGIAINKLEQERGGVFCEEDLCTEMKMTAEELAELQEEVREIKFISFDEDETNEDNQSLHEVVADESCPPALAVLERKELLAILAERIAQMPDTPKRVLAMYYYENMKIAEIAACFGVTESRICQIHTQSLRLLRTYMANFLH